METGERCRSGMEITTPAGCRDAIRWASELQIAIDGYTDLSVKSVSYAPYQCSYQAGGNQHFYFNRRKTIGADQFVDGNYKMICKKSNFFLSDIIVIYAIYYHK